MLNGLRGCLGSINVPVTLDLTGFVERIRAFLAGIEISVRIVLDFDGVDRLDAQIGAHRPPPVTVETDVDADRLTRALCSLGGIAGRVDGALTGLLTFGAVGIAAAGAPSSVGSLVAALAPAAGIVAAFLAAIAGAQVALGTMRLAVLGVSDALEAALTGDAAEFPEGP
ncbi:hypothetical protein YWIDRAFT_08046 [Streptomyces sp. SceaMP-e96]|uniref:hypothetical protein n=1 Tax=Streptomyces sp. SceaMP-e96 TaxID=1100824 RepID=UPI0008239EEE|nr:hypothetical protein [Streptomyces sp. SceaMP-e96]SCK54608.1 hypothetical protein YWIDRAFT_08046 [Streptomyces sp. SceaMP-e96]